jgi:hypothetical protein
VTFLTVNGAPMKRWQFHIVMLLLAIGWGG